MVKGCLENVLWEFGGTFMLPGTAFWKVRKGIRVEIAS
jgi:hypothetical protein